MKTDSITKTGSVHIIDTTLKSFAHRQINLSHDDRLTLASKLAATGVDELEAGIPVLGKWEQRFLKRLIARGLSPRISGWCNLSLNDLEAAHACGIKDIRISLPVSPESLEAKRMSASQMMERLRSLMVQWRGAFDSISLELEDAFYGDDILMHNFLKAIPKMGIAGLRIVDSRGTATAGEIESLVGMFSTLSGPEVDFQGFNNPVFALNNFTSALEGGARSLSLKVNAYKTGSRGAALMELLSALRDLDWYTGRMKPLEILPISKYVYEIEHRKIG
ncbi:MAG: hypothetical protein JEY99_09480 [Spirochaetales bacterium]|nr:hypothetical protein [Spirochaetales bacterium]